jgi:hypothetical protein
MNVSEESTVLLSWKDIARYLGKGVRTVQRWERHLGLPVRRPTGASQKSAVLLYRGEVDAWLATRFSARPINKHGMAEGPQPSDSARSALKERIRTARELRAANQALTEEIYESIRLLAEQCELLTSNRLQMPRLPADFVTSEFSAGATPLPNYLANPRTPTPEQIA